MRPHGDNILYAQWWILTPISIRIICGGFVGLAVSSPMLAKPCLKRSCAFVLGRNSDKSNSNAACGVCQLDLFPRDFGLFIASLVSLGIGLPRAVLAASFIGEVCMISGFQPSWISCR